LLQPSTDSPLEALKRTEHPAARHVLLRTRGYLHAVARGHAVRKQVIARYLVRSPAPAVHFGAGPKRIDGRLNTDLISGDVYVDLERRLPFPDASLAYAFGEHVIGSLSEAGGIGLLGELHRVLRPGGVLRLTTPDLRKLLALYGDESPVVGRAEYLRYLDRETGKAHATPCQAFNDAVRLWGIRYTYDEEDLAAKLTGAGFASVERVEPGESRHERLRGLERHGEPWVNRVEALTIEAVRS
jgi:predicted SAM-dependent methyltransferase